MTNQALHINGNSVNGKSAAIHITTHGSDWYWAVTAVMAFCSLIFIGLSFTKPRTHRIFHYITAAITFIAAIAYFSMASNLGWTPIDVEFRRSDSIVRGVNREIFYVRYIDWFLTTPLLLLDLLLTAGLPWPTLLWTIFMDEIMIVTGLVGALVRSSYKWGYFTFGCAALVVVCWTVTWTARKHANALGSDIGQVYLYTGAWTMFLWFLYPIAWGVCEGGNVISPDSEAIFYGILDICAKPIFGAMLLFGHRNIDPGRMGLLIRDYAEGTETATTGTGGFFHREKRGVDGTDAAGATNGTAPVTTEPAAATTAAPAETV